MLHLTTSKEDGSNDLAIMREFLASPFFWLHQTRFIGSQIFHIDTPEARLSIRR